MPDILFSVTAKDGREIRLTHTQWKHIAFRHPEMGSKPHEIKEALRNPTTMRKHSEHITKFYKSLKEEKKYIMVAVKILDHEGFVVTAYLTRKIQRERTHENEGNHL